MVEKETVQAPRFVALARANPWMVSTFVLGVLFLIALFIATTGPSTGAVVSSGDVGQKVLTALNAQTGGGVTLDSVAEESGLYKVMVSYQGDSVPVYATLDGTKLAFQVIALDGSLGGNLPPTSDTADNNAPVVIDVNQIKNAPVKGLANAPVTIVEFSDFECPFCERFYSDAYKQIDEQYIKTGKAKVIFMQFPLGFHAEAQKAAEASLCAQAQKGNDGFWKMHDKLFENQDSLSMENYKKWAREIGLNGALFDGCLDKGDFEARVNAELAYGQSLGVSGTPSFFVNGKPLVGAQPFSAFKQIIDAELVA
ncbi:MAG: thioredoxin domain-containing protein [Nanoarchaeota archaeon]